MLVEYYYADSITHLRVLRRFTHGLGCITQFRQRRRMSGSHWSGGEFPLWGFEMSSCWSVRLEDNYNYLYILLWSSTSKWPSIAQHISGSMLRKHERVVPGRLPALYQTTGITDPH